MDQCTGDAAGRMGRSALFGPLDDFGASSARVAREKAVTDRLEQTWRQKAIRDTFRPLPGHRPEIGTRPDKVVALAHDDPGPFVVQPKAGLGGMGQLDPLVGRLGGRVGDWQDDDPRAVLGGADRQHDGARPILHTLLAASPGFAGPEI